MTLFLVKYVYRTREGRAKQKEGNVETVQIDGIPIKLRRHNLFTDLSNPKVFVRVDYFVTLLNRFKQVHPSTDLKILIIPFKEVVLHSAEIQCSRTDISSVVLHELDLPNYVMRELVSAGFQVEDALANILKEYCQGPNHVRNEFYPDFDGHPYSEGYKGYAQAADVLHNRS